MKETNMTETEAKNKVQIMIWSAIGHTPVTGRRGSYCDELLKKEFECRDFVHAKALLARLLLNTEHADKGHFYCPAFGNNFTTLWMNRSEAFPICHKYSLDEPVRSLSLLTSAN